MQWLWLILAAVAVVGAYFFLRRQSAQDPWRELDESGEPEDFDRGEALGGDSYVVGVRTAHPEQARGRAEQTGAQTHGDDASWRAFSTDPPPLPDRRVPAEARRKPGPAPENQQVVVLHVASREGRLHDGPDIHAALAEQKLKFGLNEIYHRITEINGLPESVYGVANMLKPGFLDPLEQDHLQTPGVTLFLQLPGPLPGAEAARDMLATANGLARSLGAEVLDEKRSVLAPQSAQYMLDQIAELDRKQRLIARK